MVRNSGEQEGSTITRMKPYILNWRIPKASSLKSPTVCARSALGLHRMKRVGFK